MKFQKIIKTGEYSNQIFYVKKGQVSVMVKNIEKQENVRKRLVYLDTIRSGASFNTIGAILERPAIFDYISGSKEEVTHVFDEEISSQSNMFRSSLCFSN